MKSIKTKRESTKMATKIVFIAIVVCMVFGISFNVQASDKKTLMMATTTSTD
ncbi:MAG: hypothetical protein HQK69_07675, partial [Desulfamplus sp.]|nr:hypothetical protein [Desulfamplus sp.]